MVGHGAISGMQIRHFPIVSDYRTVGAGATEKAPTDQSSTQGQWGLPEDIMKVRGNQTFIMPRSRLAKIRKGCQRKKRSQ
jgi:hypothetical protein